PDYPRQSGLYRVPVEGGRVRRVGAGEGREGVYAPRGDRIAYVRGPGDAFRRGYRGSSNNDVWVCDADGGNNRQLTGFDGQDGSPTWGPDGRTVYYVSEVFGTPANVVRQEVSEDGGPAGKPVLVTADK